MPGHLSLFCRSCCAENDRSLLKLRVISVRADSPLLPGDLPLAVPGIVAASLIVFIPTVGDYITPKLVGGTEGLMIAMIQVQFSAK